MRQSRNSPRRELRRMWNIWSIFDQASPARRIGWPAHKGLLYTASTHGRHKRRLIRPRGIQAGPTKKSLSVHAGPLGTTKMEKTARILYCHCAYATVVPKEVKEEVLARLSASGVAFDAGADLCVMSARNDPAMKELAP